MSGSILAVAVFIVGVAATLLWFGVSRRREAEIEVGIQSLANMKWRDSIAVVLEALQREGIEQRAARTGAAAGDSRGTDMLLSHGDSKVLLAYKHGTAYRLGDTNVQEFVGAMQQRGAQQGILMTLGSTEPGAEAAAKAAGVQLLDGRSLWLKVRQFMPPETLEMVHGQAAALTRRGLISGVSSSLLAGVATYLVGNLLLGPGLEASAVAPAPGSASQAYRDATQASGRIDPMLDQLNATAKAMAEVAKLSSAELASRRVQAAKAIALMPQVNTAAWSGQSRLLVTLDRSDGKDKVLIDEMCRQLTRYEELRYTRIQMEPPPGSDLPVRWRLCD